MEWDIFEEMQRIQEEMERMFNASSCTSCQGPGSIPRDRRPGDMPRRPGSIPRSPQDIPGRGAVVDVQQTDTSVIVTAEVVGMEKGDIDLRVTPDEVEITAKKDKVQEIQGPGRELHTVVPLPVPVKSHSATTTCKNGVLEITLPKDEEATKSENIEIK